MRHPYRDAPDERWWRTLASTDPADVDPVIAMPFRIARTDRIVSAGSCFAQHLSRHLRARGFTYLVTESAHPIVPQEVADACHYGVYSARYGNIYTSRQLLQLLRRAFGRLTPCEDAWSMNGRWFDPFRPAIQPDGYASRQEFEADRRQHFAAVRRAFETMDVFIFTLGFTECWASRLDGMVYPICPGVAAGEFDPDRHALLNLSVGDVTADLIAFIAEVRAINPGVRIVLTVSPVPPIVTAQDRHVLLATAHMQAVLRVAAEELTRVPGVAYFPALEIVTGAFTRGAYWADDLRGIREDGVEHVMRLFFRHTTEGVAEPIQPRASRPDRFLEQMRDAVDAVCEHDQLEADAPEAS
jgi:hypothetical protein